MNFNVIYYFASILLPVTAVMVFKGLGVGEALFGCFIASIVVLYKILENKLSLDSVKEHKEKLELEFAQKIEQINNQKTTELELQKAHLKLEYEGRIAKLEELLTRNNLEKIKRF